MATRKPQQSTEAARPTPETAEQWWVRVRAEHGAPPASLATLWRSTCDRVAARAREARS